MIMIHIQRNIYNEPRAKAQAPGPTAPGPAAPGPAAPGPAAPGPTINGLKSAPVPSLRMNRFPSMSTIIHNPAGNCSSCGN